MRVSRQKSEENRQAVIAAAGHLFRAHGYDGIGLSDLMKAAGLTHGGFYKKFESKDDLQRQATAAALAQSRQNWKDRIGEAAGDPLETFVRGYLSTRQRDRIAQGCPLVALGPDAARRQDSALHAIFGAEVQEFLAFIETLLPEGERPKADRAAATLAMLIGGLMLSRMVDDPALSDRVL
ncbi:TetR/AcrR family transcriptional regulator, partial [Thioclava sp. BHET1]